MPIRAVVTICLLMVTLLVSHIPTAFADSLSFFDFNDVPISTKKSDSAAQIESYMENIYGADIAVGPRDRRGRASVRATNDPAGRNLGNSNTNPLGIFAPATEFPNIFLMSGKGKNPGIVITFGGAPIHSFAMDWQLFKNARGLTIRADGEIIFERGLTKAERKLGLLGHQGPFFFDDPVHTLEFIGWKKSKFGIDNLAVNFPLPSDGDLTDGPADPSAPVILDEPGPVIPGPIIPGSIPPGPITIETASGAIESIPEPATLILLSVGLLVILAYQRSTPRLLVVKGKV